MQHSGQLHIRGQRLGKLNGEKKKIPMGTVLGAGSVEKSLFYHTIINFCVQRS